MLLFDAIYVVVRLFIVAKTGITEFTSLDAFVGSLSTAEGGILGAVKIFKIKRGGSENE